MSCASPSGLRLAGLAYEPTGRLWSLEASSGAVTRFLYAGSDLIVELNSSNQVLKRYAPGPRGDEPLVWYEGAGLGTRRYLQADALGSIVAVSGDGAASIATNLYDEYGVSAATNLGRFQYTGQIFLPEVRAYHYKARVYSPNIGRFLQADPSGYDDGLNWYAYVGNDPTNRADPSGMARCGATLSGPECGVAMKMQREALAKVQHSLSGAKAWISDQASGKVSKAGAAFAKEWAGAGAGELNATSAKQFVKAASTQVAVLSNNVNTIEKADWPGGGRTLGLQMWIGSYNFSEKYIERGETKRVIAHESGHSFDPVTGSRPGAGDWSRPLNLDDVTRIEGLGGFPRVHE